jgi:hypothetical protein
LEEELTFKESYLNLLRERRQREEQPEEREEEREEEMEESGNGSNKYPPVQRSHYKSSHSSEEERPQFEEEKPSKSSILQKYSRMKESLAKQVSQHSEEEWDYRKRFEQEE